MLHVLIIMSLMSPPFIGAYSWIVLLGRNGLLARVMGAIGMTAPTIYGRNAVSYTHLDVYKRQYSPLW